METKSLSVLVSNLDVLNTDFNYDLLVDNLMEDVCDKLGIDDEDYADLYDAIRTEVFSHSFNELMCMNADSVIECVTYDLKLDFLKYVDNKHYNAKSILNGNTPSDMDKKIEEYLSKLDLVDLSDRAFEPEAYREEFYDAIGYTTDSADDSDDNKREFETTIFLDVIEPRHSAETYESLIRHRLGKYAKYQRWSACEIKEIKHFESVGTAVIYFQIYVHISGNSTYTSETIEKAVRNRLGRDARVAVRDEFKLFNVETKRVR